MGGGTGFWRNNPHPKTWGPPCPGPPFPRQPPPACPCPRGSRGGRRGPGSGISSGVLEGASHLPAVGQEALGIFWALFGSCLWSECEISPGKRKPQVSPGQSYCSLRGEVGAQRGGRRVEPGILYWTRTKALERCKRAERPTLSCCPARAGGCQGQSLSGTVRREYTLFLVFTPKSWCPALLPPLGQRDPAPAAASGWTVMVGKGARSSP